MAISQNTATQRVSSLITLTGVREMVENGTVFECKYELVEVSHTGMPKYIALYTKEDNEEEYVLISSNWASDGPRAKLLGYWPGLIHHHNQFGQGKPLKLDILPEKINTDKKIKNRRAIYLGG